MIFVIDEIGGTGESFPNFSEQKRHLVNALLAASGEAGDSSHVSGPADYAVRITTSKWTFTPIPVPNAFVVVDNVDNVAVFKKLDGSELQSLAVFSSSDDWFAETVEAFKEFREQLEA